MKSMEAQLEWLEGHIGKDTECCGHCKHFVQHYTIDKIHGGFHMCFSGHCCYPRHKPRKPHQCCDHFEKRGDTKDADHLETPY